MRFPSGGSSVPAVSLTLSFSCYGQHRREPAPAPGLLTGSSQAPGGASPAASLRNSRQPPRGLVMLRVAAGVPTIPSNPMTMTRRHVVAAGLAGAAGLALPAGATAARRRLTPLARTATFPSGVASGLPTERGITLWSQVDGLER